MLRQLFIFNFLLLCLYLNVHAQYRLLWTQAEGPSDHITLLKSFLEESCQKNSDFIFVSRENISDHLQEKELIHSGLVAPAAEVDSLPVQADALIKASITMLKPRVFLLVIKLIDANTLEVKNTQTLEYEGPGALKELANHVVKIWRDLESPEEPSDKSMLPSDSSETELKFKYLAQEKIWVKTGLSAWDWKEYYESQTPFTQWIKTHTFQEANVRNLGFIPGYSGLYQTGEYGKAFLFSALECLAMTLAYQSKSKRGLALGGLLVIDLADGFVSGNSARNSNQIVSKLTQYYGNQAFPFEFMY